MPNLPALSGRRVVAVFESLGWVVARQRGSQIILVKDNHNATLSVPDHKEVARGTLRSLIRAAGIAVEEFIGAAKLQNLPSHQAACVLELTDDEVLAGEMPFKIAPL